MNLFIDSTQKDFVCVLFDNKFNIIKQTIIETKYKVEEIINFFNDIKDVNNIKNFYINLGPGSFTGSRISLLYIRTISQISKAKIYITNSFKLIKNKNKLICISANKNKSYCLNNNHEILICDKQEESKIDYVELINNFEKYVHLFELCAIEKLKPIYASDPNIGKIKGEV